MVVLDLDSFHDTTFRMPSKSTNVFEKMFFEFSVNFFF